MHLRQQTFLVVILLAFSCFQCASIEAHLGSPPASTSGSSSDMQVRQALVDFAMQQNGSRYKYAGRSPQTGFDCSGFTHFVYNKFNISLTPMSSAQENEGKRIAVERAQPGDLIFFRRSATSNVFHVALVVQRESNNLTVVHSTSSRGVITENIYASSYWRNKISSARDMISR